MHPAPSYTKGQIVEIQPRYRQRFYGRQYGVVSAVKFLDNLPILSVILPLDNGMRMIAEIGGDKLTLIHNLEEVTV